MSAAKPFEMSFGFRPLLNIDELIRKWAENRPPLGFAHLPLREGETRQ